MNIVIPMAGLGSRFKSDLFKTIKPLIPIAGKPMIHEVLKSLKLSGNYHFVIRNDEYVSQLTHVLKELIPNCNLIYVNEVTDGPASTCLMAQNLIDSDEQLIIANSDQVLWWNADIFQELIKINQLDGLVVTFDSNSLKNSYARIDKDGFVLEIKEKVVISDLALAGIHYWKRGRDFVSSANQMINDKNRSFGEYYVGPTYNYLIQEGAKISTYHLSKLQHYPVGTPEDLQKYEEKLWRDLN